MCGIAGIVDLEGSRDVDALVLARMAEALVHRGPDEFGYFRAEGIGLASRRLSIVGLADGRQPIWNESQTVGVVFNGELFDHPEQRRELEARGHVFSTSCDTEILVHLWEEHGLEMFERLRGQFAFALFDRRRSELILARDRVGICPLHWAIEDGRLYFASEIKGVLASGQVPARADLRGLDHIFTFFAMPSRRTAFEGISSLAPGTYLRIELPSGSGAGRIREHRYWDLDFPDRGEEYRPQRPETLLDEYDSTFRRAVELRLRADVPVASYLSGGVDSGVVLGVASRVRGTPLASFTVQIASRGFDETPRAQAAARAIGSRNTVVRCDAPRLTAAYPRLIQAADCPVVDTSCAALIDLAGEVRRQGFKVALTGEGSDEALAGYAWFKFHKLLERFDHGAFRPGSGLSYALRRLFSLGHGSQELRETDRLLGGVRAQTEFYFAVSLARRRFYSDAMREALGGHLAYEDLDLDRARMRRWHPLNQSLYVGYKTMLPGMLLSHKGDRVALANSIETRYPFLDEDVIALCARVDPSWKLRGVFGDKYLLRRVAERYVPLETARRPKGMFRAPLVSTFFAERAPYVDQLLSDESLRRTPYFDPRKVAAKRDEYLSRSGASGRRPMAEMGFVAVLATQLWHHLYLGGGLCELPTWSPEALPVSASA